MTHSTATEETSDNMLMALCDGELPEAEAAHLHQRIANDPALAARFALFARTRSAVQAAVAPGPVPDRLVRAILSAPVRATDGSGRVIALPVHNRSRGGLAPLHGLAALAATIALALGLGGFLIGRGMAPPPLVIDPATQAATALAMAATGDTVALADGGSARVLASYDTDIGLCRLIALDIAGGSAERAVICREPTGWGVALSVSAGAAESYLPASDTAVGLIDSFLDEIGATAPLDPTAEATALRR